MSPRAPGGRGGDAAGSESRSPLCSFWRSAAGFWGRRGTWAAWVLSGILSLIVLLNLAASYGMNVWHRGIFDALQARDSATVLQLSLLYLPLLAGSVLLMVTQVFARMTMQRR
jgi:putative ATP-binding cassette transporter